MNIDAHEKDRTPPMKGWEQYVLALLLFSFACSAAIVLYHIDKHIFLYFGDAAAHIVRARQFIDSQRPGFHNIGTVWLPLPHLLLLPFAMVDALFYSGIAGPVVGIPLFVATGVLLFWIARILNASRPIAFLTACLFGLNPNIIYMALTPMNESSLLFFVALGGYALLRWLNTKKERWLLLCAAAVMLASLCRYEAWLLAPFVSLVAARRAMPLWRQGERAAVARVLAIGALCWTGIVFWLCWNHVVYGDVLMFAHRTYAAGTITVRNSLYHQPQDVFIILGKAILYIFGPVLLLSSAIVFVRIRNVAAKQQTALILLFFSLPAVFAVTSILGGFVQLDEWWWNWRYVLTLGLFLSIAGAVGLDELFSKVQSRFFRGIVVISLLAVPIIQITDPSVGVATFKDAAKGYFDNTRFATVAGEELRSAYKGGSVALLTGYSQAQRIMLASGLPLRQFHISYDPGEKSLMGSLWDLDQYLLIGMDKTPESVEIVDYWLSRKEELLHFYNLHWGNGHFILMERKK